MSAIEKYKPYDEVGTCSVCQEDPDNGDLIWHLSACNHIYHKGCIEPWVERNTTCPTCRQPFTRPAALADTAKFKKTLAYAFTIKIVNSLLISDYKRELPTIKMIIGKYSLNGVRMNPTDIDTTNLHTFYESYECLEAEMRSVYNYHVPTGLTMIPIIQALIRRLISYAPMWDLIDRCSQ